MKKNYEFESEIIDVSSDGYGVAKVNGEVVFVLNAITGEKVRAKVINAKTKFAIAKVQEFLSVSSHRTEPPCPYFGKCGGCDFQHINYEHQLKIKQNQVENCLKKYAGINFRVEPCVASENVYEYRNKIALPVVQGENGAVIGLYKVASHNIVEIDNCLIQKPFTKKLISIFKEYFKNNNITGFNEETKSGQVKHIVARQIQNKMLITIVATTKNLPNLNTLYETLKNEFSEIGLNININNLNNNVILTNTFFHVAGFKELEVTECGIKVNINANSFYQVNDYIKTKIYERVCQLVGENDVVIDAYSGAGLLTAILSKSAKQVYGVEIVEAATKNANDLIKQNGITNVKNINGDCATVVPELIKSLKTNATVVLDPPRKGCDAKVLNAIVNANAEKIIYVSCNPATLARDLGVILKSEKYALTQVTPFDMFPQTKHVETVACLKLK